MKLGFIGCGNMARAMIRGILSAKIVPPEDIIGTNTTYERARDTAKMLGIESTTDHIKVARDSDILFLGMKPQQYEDVIHEIKDVISEETIVVSIAPGKALAWFEKLFGKPVKLVRTMPNTPILVGEGMTGICCGKQMTEIDIQEIFRLFNGFGKAEAVTEREMDIVSAVSGSSPAFVYMFIEAMADAAVLEGFSREKAYKFAAQAVLGGARMVLDTNRHPGALKDEVCSPGGSTIQGVRVLEEKGMRSSVIEAMKATMDKAKGI